MLGLTTSGLMHLAHGPHAELCCAQLLRLDRCSWISWVVCKHGGKDEDEECRLAAMLRSALIPRYITYASRYKQDRTRCVYTIYIVRVVNLRLIEVDRSRHFGEAW